MFRFILVFVSDFTLLLILLNEQGVILHVKSYKLGMVVTKCPIYGCDYQTPDQPCDLVCRLLDLHKMEHEKNSGSSNDVVMPNGPQLIRPRVDRGISQET